MTLLQQPNSLYERLGGTTLPPRTEHFTDGVARDPAKHTMLALFESAIKYELAGSTSTVVSDSLWNTVRTGTPHAAVSPVEDKVPMPGLPQLLKERGNVFPALWLDRMGEQETAKVQLDQENLTSRWLLTYVLGPLDVGSAIRFRDVCTKIVPAIIRSVCRHRCHGSYQSGVVQFGTDTDALLSLRLVNFTADPLPIGGGDDGPLYYGVGMTLETTEGAAEIEPDGIVQPPPERAYNISVGGKDGLVQDLVQTDNKSPAPHA